MITSPVSLGFIVRGGEDAAIKVDETTIIVEFGNDKHCRIPMEKSAIQAMEKANASSSEE